MQNITTTSTSTSADYTDDYIPIQLTRFKNLDNLRVQAMPSYALPDSHKDVSLLCHIRIKRKDY